ncbi:MAG: response regulator [Candidatus Marinimicrobia bacterium]|nr:response regulator [Candidatus Neomarinimicrobiota bacterium]
MSNKAYKGKILVVDDDKDLSAIIQEELQNVNYYVRTANQYQEALDVCTQDKFDIGLIDHNLINYTGLELINDLKEVIPTMDYIIVTGQASLNNAIRAFQHEKILYYEEKPINFDRLISFIDQRLDWIKMEKSLKKSEKKFRQIFNNINDAIYLHQLDENGMPGDFLEVNELACEMLGFSRQELLQMSHRDVDKNRDQNGTKAVMKKLLEEKNMTYETVHLNKEGQEIPVEVSSHIFELENENVILSVARDISERKQAQAEKKKLYEQLLQTQKLESIGQLAGGVAHDFNNILTVITCQTEMIRMNMDENNPNYSDLESICNSVQRAKRLTQQLLLFSRKHHSDFRSLNLNYIIDQLLKMIRRLIGENIAIETKLEDDLHLIKADEGQIEQVVINLAINARDAMPEGGKLTLSTQNINAPQKKVGKQSNYKDGQFVRLVIEDNGKGISEEIQDKIFDPFFTTKGKSKGTGMGLSVVYGIIKKHDGWIDVKSEVGQGTRFIIDLPACQEEPDEEEEVRPEEFSQLKGDKEKILIIEDEVNLTKAAQEMLEYNNYEVDTASDGQEALEKLENKDFYYDLIISDVLLPDTNGIKLLDSFRKFQGDIPIIFSSGYADERSKQEKILDKGIPFIQKPFKIKDLLKKVRTVLDEN